MLFVIVQVVAVVMCVRLFQQSGHWSVGTIHYVYISLLMTWAVGVSMNAVIASMVELM
jgi:hypothetical protein